MGTFLKVVGLNFLFINFFCIFFFKECNGQKLLSLHFKSPLSINNKEVKSIKMNFELEHDIQNATIKTYGEDLQMVRPRYNIFMLTFF